MATSNETSKANGTSSSASEINENASNPPKVLIIGAGSTGLALGQGLKKAGIPFGVYEREEAPRDRTWSIGLHWGMGSLRELVPDEIVSKIQQAQVDPHIPTNDDDRVPFINGETGELINEIKSSKFYRLRRDKFRHLLMEGIEEQVHWGKAITDAVYSEDNKTVTAIFADGTKETGCLLVASDGPHSAVRTLLLGEELARVTPIDFACAMCFTKHTREHAIQLRAPPFQPILQAAAHPEGYLAFLTLQNGDDKEHPENWLFFHYISFPEPRDFVNTKTTGELIAQQKELAKKFVDPWKSVFEWMSEDADVSYHKLRNWDPSLPQHRWDNHGGRVTLAGDAAHAMTFQRGQGLNNAIQDAFQLCKAIESFWNGGDYANEARREQIAAYETEMIRRTGLEVRLSEQSSVDIHNWSRIMQSPIVKQGLHVEKK